MGLEPSTVLKRGQEQVGDTAERGITAPGMATLRHPNRRTKPTSTRSRGRSIRIACFAAVACAVVLLWQLDTAILTPGLGLAGRPREFWLLGMLVCGHMLLTFALQRLLSYTFPSWSRPWSYRLAFLFGAGVTIAVWIDHVLMLPVSPAIASLGSAALGSFAGGLLATAFDDGLWEDTYPPSPGIEAAVRLQHQSVLRQLPTEPHSKRLFDLALALSGLLLSAPLWLVSMFLVWFEDPGPVFFIKNSVGRGGINFQQIKFRSMIRNAEEETGPIPSPEHDERTLVIGRFLRKTALDELPQLINIVRGEMSFVGPRPLRTVVIYNILHDVPHFAERHAVRPGLAGLSQVIGGYYITPRQRLRFDRLYVRHMHLVLDIKILLLALLIVLWLRWGKEYHGRTARRWLHLRSY